MTDATPDALIQLEKPDQQLVEQLQDDVFNVLTKLGLLRVEYAAREQELIAQHQKAQEALRSALQFIQSHYVPGGKGPFTYKNGAIQPTR